MMTVFGCNRKASSLPARFFRRARVVSPSAWAMPSEARSPATWVRKVILILFWARGSVTRGPRRNSLPPREDEPKQAPASMTFSPPTLSFGKGLISPISTVPDGLPEGDFLHGKKKSFPGQEKSDSFPGEG